MSAATGVKKTINLQTSSTAKTKRVFYAVTPLVIKGKVQPQKFHLTKGKDECKDPGDAARKEANRKFHSEKSDKAQKVYSIGQRVYIYDRSKATVRVYKIVDQKEIVKELPINQGRSIHKTKILQTTMKFEGHYAVDRYSSEANKKSDVLYTGPMKHNIRKAGSSKISQNAKVCKTGPCKNVKAAPVKQPIKPEQKSSNTNIKIKSEPKRK